MLHGEGVSSVRYLVEHKADINLVRHQYALNYRVKVESPLVELCSRRFDVADAAAHLRVIELLLENGADIHYITSTEVHDALSAALKIGRLDIVRLLLRYGADVNPPTGTNKLSQTYLQILCCRQVFFLSRISVDAVQFLLDSGVDTNATLGGPSALQGAISSGNFEVVLCLLTAGADPDYQTSRCKPVQSCLGNAAHWGRYDIMKLLLNAGATQGLDEAIDIARKRGSSHILELLTSPRTLKLHPSSDVASLEACL